MQISQTLQAIIAGIFQGITELLPVSSSGHLLLLDYIFQGNLQILEIAVLHLGTLASIFIVFRKDLKLYFNKDFLIKVLISSLPAGLLGFLLEEVFEINLTSPYIIIFTLIFWGILLIVADQKSTQSNKKTANSPNKLQNLSFKQAAIIGIGQCLALIPGTSRSGVTTLAGIFAGLKAENALRYSFLTGIPLISMSGFYALLKMLTSQDISASVTTITLGTFISFIVGLLAAYVLKKFINKNILTACGIYRILLGLGILIFVV